MNNLDLENLLFYSFKHALGEGIFAASDVAPLLLKHKNVLRDTTKELIENLIRNAVLGQKAGTNAEIAIWEKVRDEL